MTASYAGRLIDRGACHRVVAPRGDRGGPRREHAMPTRLPAAVVFTPNRLHGPTLGLVAAEGLALVKTVLDSLATVKTPGDGRYRPPLRDASSTCSPA